MGCVFLIENVVPHLLSHNTDCFVSVIMTFLYKQFQFGICGYGKVGLDIQTVNSCFVFQQVHGNFDFQDEDESNIQDQTFKEFLFEDTFKFLLSNESSTSTFLEILQKIRGSTVNKVVNSTFSH